MRVAKMARRRRPNYPKTRNNNVIFNLGMPKSINELLVLIADGDRRHRDIVRDILLAIGVKRGQIRECGDGAEALDLLSIQRSDLLITEWQMKPMDGLTLLRKLRDPAITPAPGIPVIFFASEMDMALLDEVFTAGADAVLTQPMTAAKVQSRVTALVEKPRPIIRTDTYVGPDTGNHAKDNFWNIC